MKKIIAYFYNKFTEPTMETCAQCHNRFAKGKNLIFISRILRDGNGVERVGMKDMSFYDDTRFILTRLSITNDTWLAIGFNSYIVKYKIK